MNKNNIEKPSQGSALILLTRAVHFAARKHKDQRRKGEDAAPYFNHLSEVAELLAQNTNGSDPNLIVAGYLHDTIEDVGVTYLELMKHFGEDVATLVMEVTDDKSLPKAVRKQLQIEHAPYRSKRAQMIKIADKISNLRTIMNSPPADWDLARKQEYFEWAKKVVDGCKGANEGLEKIFLETYKQGLQFLTEEANASQGPFEPASTSNGKTGPSPCP